MSRCLRAGRRCPSRAWNCRAAARFDSHRLACERTTGRVGTSSSGATPTLSSRSSARASTAGGCAPARPKGHAERSATRLMHRLGFSPQVPARRVAERDEQAVTAWKEATWAEVKEPGRPAEATSASRTRQASPAGRPKHAPGAGAAEPRSWR
ncbi:winged helix-turn-helix domain-containing protein [Streptomyces sp. NPDC002764]|uniref:helix-turn-helix domain-containing protein n=1 Tax=Streptomyces sp. NPDC002764 TaxID=3154428 RepID=UPI003333D6F7